MGAVTLVSDSIQAVRIEPTGQAFGIIQTAEAIILAQHSRAMAG